MRLRQDPNVEPEIDVSVAEPRSRGQSSPELRPLSPDKEAPNSSTLNLADALYSPVEDRAYAAGHIFHQRLAFLAVVPL